MSQAIPWTFATLLGIERGRTVSVGALSLGAARLNSDPVGTTVVTLTNIAVGSRYRFERVSNGSLATPTGNAEGVAASSTVVVSLDYYAFGNANNNVRIKVRKATSGSPYKPYETQAVLGAAAQSIYIAQVQD